MRQLIVRVPKGYGADVLDIAQRYQGAKLACSNAIADNASVELVFVHLSNRKVENFLEDLEPLPQLHVTLFPTGAIVLKPPPEEAPEQVRNVTDLSPIEVFLAGLQSVGSWKGFLGYSAVGGAVVWTGLFTNSSYLLVAAMLIAPFAGPAANVAIATARGDTTLLWQGLRRYFAAIGVTIGVAAVLSLILAQDVATASMVSTSEISIVSVLLPLAAGTAGALNLFQSERSSLVSGAATGMLVAASLAPPAGLIGMAAAIGRWNMVVSGVFALLLQLAGINLAGTIVFRLYGLSARGARYHRGRQRVFPAVLGTTIAMLAALLVWQFSNAPNLQRSSRAQRAEADVQQVVEGGNLAHLVEANARFTRSDISGQNTLLVNVYVQPKPEVTASTEDIRQQLTRNIQSYFIQQDYDVTPLVDVSVLEPPGG